MVRVLRLPRARPAAMPVSAKELLAAQKLLPSLDPARDKLRHRHELARRAKVMEGSPMAVAESPAHQEMFMDSRKEQLRRWVGDRWQTVGALARAWERVGMSVARRSFAVR